MLAPRQSEIAHQPAAKSAAAFRTIAEAADELDLPQHVLRFWESKFPQVRPLKRRGGRRYYRPEDIDLLRRIRALLHVEGYTIKGVQKILREDPAVRPPASDGRDRGTAGSGAASADTPCRADQRGALRAILAELETIRGLLRFRRG
jgi:DNA-binding transcriptional MerR regulator